MFDKLNPFKKPQPGNPLDALSEDELRAARKKLEYNRDRTLKQIRDLESQKGRLLEAGAQSELRVRRDLAYQVKDTEEQIRQLDRQREALAKEIQFINRLTFAKKIGDQVGKLEVDQLMGKMDISMLRTYIEDISVRGTVGFDRIDELLEMFDQSWAVATGMHDDPDLGRIMEEMERRAISSLPDIGVSLDAPVVSDPKGAENKNQS